MPGKIHDKSFAEYNRIHLGLEEDEWAIGDSGYQGMPKFIVPFKGELDNQEKEANKFLGRLVLLLKEFMVRSKSLKYSNDHGEAAFQTTTYCGWLPLTLLTSNTDTTQLTQILNK